jgi:hypothetical protein
MSSDKGMSSDQVLTLILAGYGALLSTLLALREWRNGRRRIRIRLDRVHFYEIAQLTITNVGYRPVTITGIEIIPKGRPAVPSNSLLSPRFESTPLPATINDGEHITLPLADVVSDQLNANGMKATLKVYDSEGRTYRKYKTGTRNPKWVRGQ